MQSDPTPPDPEVPPKATRRRFSAAEKARILEEYEAASALERAALCRREHVYSSLICNWRNQLATGAPLEAQRGRKSDPQAVENTQLRKENERLQKRLAKAERVIDIQGKAYALLRTVVGESADDGLAAVEQVVMDLSAELGERGACRQVGHPRASFQRRYALGSPAPCQDVTPAPIVSDIPAKSSHPHQRYLQRQGQGDQVGKLTIRRSSSLALTSAERQAVLDLIHQPRFVDRSVPYIYATLLDAGVRPCSISTMYRILHRVGEVGERRDQATRPAHVKPELCATAARQVMAWDITKLHGPKKWRYYHLYTVIDIFSRYIVGWMVADREDSHLARLLLEETIRKEGHPDGLVIHSDRGSSMTSKPVAFLLADLGVTKSHSRPHVSNDNPHIESFFKTAKYQPEFPSTFANIVEAREFCRTFIAWYNAEHKHSALALLTPSDVHHGRAESILERRQRVLDASYSRHPHRFVNGKPRVPRPSDASYINRPRAPEESEKIAA